MITIQYLLEGSTPIYSRGKTHDRWIEKCLKEIEDLGKPEFPIAICRKISVQIYFSFVNNGRAINNDHIIRQAHILTMLEINGVVKPKDKGFARYPVVTVHAFLGGKGNSYSTVSIMFDEKNRDNTRIPIKGLPVTIRR